MRYIARDFFATNPFLFGPLIAFVIFFTVFLGVIVFVWRTRKSVFDEAAMLALDGGSPSPGNTALTLKDIRTESEATHG